MAPCVLALAPVQIALVNAAGKNKAGGKGFLKGEAFLNALLFITGFLAVFVGLALAANTAGRFVGPYRSLITRAGGVMLVILGLQVLGFLRIPFLYRTLGIRVESGFNRWGKIFPFLIGATFGLSWSPCIGPVLAVILFWSSQSQTLLKGSMLLFAYGLGLALPFLILSIFFDLVTSVTAKLEKVGQVLTIIFGLVTVAVGIALVFNSLGILMGYTLQLQSVI